MHTRLLAVPLLLAHITLFPSVSRAQPQGVTIVPRDRPMVREGTAVLKGRVVDGTTGAAVPRARVRLMGPAGPRPSVLTSDTGAFTFSRLPPGQYSVYVEKPTYLSTRFPGSGNTMRSHAQSVAIREGEPAAAVTVPLYRGGAIAGRILDAHGDPLDWVQVEVMRVSASGRTPTTRGGTSANDIGEFRIGRLEPGSYLLLASGRTMRSDDANSNENPPQPLPTYYPGVLSIDQAQPITLERGQTIAGIELMLAEGVPTTVSGVVVNPDGTQVAGDVAVGARMAQTAGGIVRGMVSGFATGPRTPGTFRMQLAPGEYVLEARLMQPPAGEQPRMEHEKFGSIRVTVGTTAIDSLVIVVGSGATATGRIIFEGTTPPPVVPSQLHLPLTAVEGSLCRSGSVRVNSDWTFRVDGLTGSCLGPYQQMFGRWMLKNVLVNGEDLLTRSITFQPGQQLRDVQVVFTDRRTSMRFQVTDDSGQPTRDYVAVVFSTDKSAWARPRRARTYMPPPQRIPTGPSTSVVPTSGMLPGPRPETLPLMVGGEYYVVAVDDMAAEPEIPTEILEQLALHAARVMVAEGSITEVSLRRLKFWDGRQ